MGKLTAVSVESDTVETARRELDAQLPPGTCVILESVQADGPAQHTTIQAWAGDPRLRPLVLGVKSWYRQRAGADTGGGICDSCMSRLVAGNSYLMPGGGQLFCEACTDRLLGRHCDWDLALKNIDNWCGPGVPASVKALIPAAAK